MKDKIYKLPRFKFRVNDYEYAGLFSRDLESIHLLIGDFKVVKVKQHWPRTRGMDIWVERRTQ